MTDSLHPRPLRKSVATWNAAGGAGLRLCAVALGAVALADAGALSPSLSPWAPVALAGGLALAAAWRWGQAAFAGGLVGLLFALLSLHLPLPPALLGTAAVGGGALLARASLQRLRFDARLERGVDVAALAFAVLFAAALPMAVALAAWQAAASGRDFLSSMATGWGVLGLGMLATTVSVLAFDRSALYALRRAEPWRDSLLGAAALLLMLSLLWLAPAPRSPVAAMALFAPHLVVVILALRGQLALAAGGLVAAGLLAAGGARGGLSIWGTEGSVQAALFACLGSALALMLAAHAAMVEWRARLRRWEWALDGSRLGVADWHLQRNESFASAAWRTLTGHLEEGWNPSAWQAQVHADDREALASAIAALTAGEVGRRQLELRLARGSGWRWAEATLMVIERDGAGRPLRLLATLADVQDRHEALERQLHVGEPVPASARRAADHRRRPARARSEPSLYARSWACLARSCWAPCRRCCGRRRPIRWRASSAPRCGPACAITAAGAASCSSAVATARCARWPPPSRPCAGRPRTCATTCW